MFVQITTIILAIAFLGGAILPQPAPQPHSYSPPAPQDRQGSQISLSFILETNTPVNCSTGLANDGVYVLVEYRLVPGEWSPLQNVTLEPLASGNCNTVDMNRVVIPAARPSNTVQFRILQPEHGGGLCNCWGARNMIVHSGSRNISVEGKCHSQSAVDGTAGQSCDPQFCGGSASVPRGAVYPPVDLNGGESILVCDDSPLVDDQGLPPTNCTNRWPRMEVSFVVEIDADGCRHVRYFDEGVEVAIGNWDNDGQWIPLKLYAPSFERSNETRHDIGIGNVSDSVGIRGYSIPYSVSSSFVGFLSVCGEEFIRDGIQIRWLHTATFRFSSNGAKSKKTWTLDDVTVTLYMNESYSVTLLNDSFTDQNTASSSHWNPELRNGILSSTQMACMENSNSTNSKLIFGASEDCTTFGCELFQTQFTASRLVSTAPLNVSSYLQSDGTTPHSQPVTNLPVTVQPSESSPQSTMSISRMAAVHSVPSLSTYLSSPSVSVSFTASPTIATRPAPVQSYSTQPAPVQSSSAQPTPVQSSSAQPPPVQSSFAQPTPVQSSSTQPAPVQSSSAQPTPVQSSSAQPPPVQSSFAQPTPVQSSSTQPAPVQSSSAQPTPVQSSSAQPPPVQSSSAQPAPVQSYSTQPAPVQSYSTQPTPVQSYSTQPPPGQSYSTQPTPVQSSSTQPAPVQSYSTQPTPVQSSSTQPTPVQSYSTQPTPVQSSSTQPTPVQSSSTQPTPVQSSSTQLTSMLTFSQYSNTIITTENTGQPVSSTTSTSSQSSQDSLSTQYIVTSSVSSNNTVQSTSTHLSRLLLSTSVSPLFTTSSLIVPTPSTSSHLMPTLSTSSHLMPTLSTSSHLMPTLSTSSHLMPALSTSSHLMPTPSTSSHLMPTPSTSSHLMPALSTSSHLMPALSTSSHLMPTPSTSSLSTSSPSTSSYLMPALSITSHLMPTSSPSTSSLSTSSLSTSSLSTSSLSTSSLSTSSPSTSSLSTSSLSTSTVFSPLHTPLYEQQFHQQLEDTLRNVLAFFERDEDLKAILSMPPAEAVQSLEGVVNDRAEVDETVVAFLLTNIINRAEGGIENPNEFSQRVLSIVDQLLARTADNNDDREPNTIAGSTLFAALEQLAFNVLRPGSEGSQTSNVVMLLTEVEFEQGAKDDDVISGIDTEGHSIELPNELLRLVSNGSDPITVGSYFYRNMSGLLPGSLPGRNDTQLVSPVISTALDCGDSLCENTNVGLKNPVRIIIPHQKFVQTLIEGDNASEVLCVFWEFFSDSDAGGSLVSGRWDTDGCVRNDNLSDSTQTVCECSHLTNFAILLSARPLPLDPTQGLLLEVIGYIGVSLSVVAMLATIVALVFLRSLWSMRNFIHINLCVSLILAQLTFVIGVTPYGGGGVNTGCKTVAVLMHYLFLVSFMWMLMEGVVLYVALVRVFVKHQRRYMAAFTITSYGLPLLYMALCVPLGFALRSEPDYGYIQQVNQTAMEIPNIVCWLNPYTNFILTFIVPVVVIILVNIGFFIMALAIMYRHSKRQTHKTRIQTMRYWLKSSVSLVAVMGITWAIGVLVFEVEVLLPLAYIFTICAAFQGVAIFVIFVVLSKQVREAYSKWWKVKVAESDILSRHFGDWSFTQGSSTAMTGYNAHNASYTLDRVNTNSSTLGPSINKMESSIKVTLNQATTNSSTLGPCINEATMESSIAKEDLQIKSSTIELDFEHDSTEKSNQGEGNDSMEMNRNLADSKIDINSDGSDLECSTTQLVNGQNGSTLICNPNAVEQDISK